MGVNGFHGNYFKSRRGLRQGDPLSPLLFDLVADVLAQTIRVAVNKKYLAGLADGWLKGGLVCLQYVDDTMVFLKNNRKVIEHFKLLMICFELASGLKINFEKSQMYELGEKSDIFPVLEEIMGCKCGKMPFKFLGIPLGQIE